MTTTDKTISPEFLDYLVKIYAYRAKFYALSDNIDDEIMLKYQIFAEDADMVAFLHNMQSGKNTDTFSLTIDYGEPLVENQCKITEFANVTLKTVKAQYDENKGQNIHFDDYLQKGNKYLPYEAFMLKDFVRNSNGSKKFIDFDRWDKDIQVFKFSKIDKLNDTMIVGEMEFIPTKDNHRTESQMNAAYNKVTKHINHAKQLIQSAERGIFPYIID